MCAVYHALQTRPLSRGQFRSLSGLFHVTNRLQARLGLLFLFLPYLTLLRGVGCFSHPVLHCTWIRPQLAHTPLTGPVLGLSGGVPLPGLQNRIQGHTQAFLFSARTHSRPFPYGERLNQLCPALLDSLTNGSHGFNGAGNRLRWCRSPTLTPKSHTGARRAEFGIHRLFLPPFLGGSPASWRSRW